MYQIQYNYKNLDGKTEGKTVYVDQDKARELHTAWNDYVSSRRDSLINLDNKTMKASSIESVSQTPSDRMGSWTHWICGDKNCKKSIPREQILCDCELNEQRIYKQKLEQEYSQCVKNGETREYIDWIKERTKMILKFN